MVFRSRGYKELTVDYLKEMQDKLRTLVDPRYTLSYYGGKLYLRSGKKGRPFITASVYRLEDFIQTKIKEAEEFHNGRFNQSNS